MSEGIAIPADVLERAVKWAAQQSMETVDMESVTLLTASQAAACLKVTPRAFRSIAVDHIDLGERRTRWSLRDIKTLIEKRRVKARA